VLGWGQCRERGRRRAGLDRPCLVGSIKEVELEGEVEPGPEGRGRRRW
jgi:hypothetical protein